MEKTILKDKIDFVAIVEVNDANPNGDPLNGNRPRTSCVEDGEIGEMADVCIKSKIRNRFMDMGFNVFYQADDRKVDEYAVLSERYRSMTSNKKDKTQDESRREACEIWDDVRAFGAVFAFKETKKNANDAVSLGIRSTVTFNVAKSVMPVDIISSQITKSANNEFGEKKGPDTMGMKHRVTHGIYIIKGSINPFRAVKSGYTEEDAELLKEALKTLFWGDASSARPDGSMRVTHLYWFRHNGFGSSFKTHNAVKVAVKDGVNVSCEIIECDL